ncbi:hypothetical protein P154DRAFT_560208 [Amniculicola lignicola CBS 123094]|uniref:Uncharacterized protein n=1 Tax=Amniculicola lignicola CBS 123094 TaxID=1392246 RepID=A0A6A5WU14_9PLEO|nr:hypothetical protein P154DRAFT_560208 [Amniculicola lignicola CBS 123094]
MQGQTRPLAPSPPKWTTLTDPNSYVGQDQLLSSTYPAAARPRPSQKHPGSRSRSLKTRARVSPFKLGIQKKSYRRTKTNLKAWWKRSTANLERLILRSKAMRRGATASRQPAKVEANTPMAQDTQSVLPPMPQLERMRAGVPRAKISAKNTDSDSSLQDAQRGVSGDNGEAGMSIQPASSPPKDPKLPFSPRTPQLPRRRTIQTNELEHISLKDDLLSSFPKTESPLLERLSGATLVGDEQQLHFVGEEIECDRSQISDRRALQNDDKGATDCSERSPVTSFELLAPDHQALSMPSNDKDTINDDSEWEDIVGSYFDREGVVQQDEDRAIPKIVTQALEDIALPNLSSYEEGPSQAGPLQGNGPEPVAEQPKELGLVKKLQYENLPVQGNSYQLALGEPETAQPSIKTPLPYIAPQTPDEIIAEPQSEPPQKKDKPRRIPVPVHWRSSLEHTPVTQPEPTPDEPKRLIPFNVKSRGLPVPKSRLPMEASRKSPGESSTGQSEKQEAPTKQIGQPSVPQGIQKLGSQRIKKSGSQNILKPDEQSVQKPAKKNVQRLVSQSISNPVTRDLQKLDSPSIQKPDSQSIQKSATQSIRKSTTPSVQNPATQSIQQSSTQGTQQLLSQSIQRLDTQTAQQPTPGHFQVPAVKIPVRASVPSVTPPPKLTESTASQILYASISKGIAKAPTSLPTSLRTFPPPQEEESLGKNAKSNAAKSQANDALNGNVEKPKGIVTSQISSLYQSPAASTSKLPMFGTPNATGDAATQTKLPIKVLVPLCFGSSRAGSSSLLLAAKPSISKGTEKVVVTTESHVCMTKNEPPTSTYLVASQRKLREFSVKPSGTSSNSDGSKSDTDGYHAETLQGIVAEPCTRPQDETLMPSKIPTAPTGLQGPRSTKGKEKVVESPIGDQNHEDEQEGGPSSSPTPSAIPSDACITQGSSQKFCRLNSLIPLPDGGFVCPTSYRAGVLEGLKNQLNEDILQVLEKNLGLTKSQAANNGASTQPQKAEGAKPGRRRNGRRKKATESQIPTRPNTNKPTPAGTKAPKTTETQAQRPKQGKGGRTLPLPGPSPSSKPPLAGATFPPPPTLPSPQGPTSKRSQIPKPPQVPQRPISSRLGFSRPLIPHSRPTTPCHRSSTPLHMRYGSPVPPFKVIKLTPDVYMRTKAGKLLRVRHPQFLKGMRVDPEQTAWAMAAFRRMRHNLAEGKGLGGRKEVEEKKEGGQEGGWEVEGMRGQEKGGAQEMEQRGGQEEATEGTEMIEQDKITEQGKTTEQDKIIENVEETLSPEYQPSSSETNHPPNEESKNAEETHDNCFPPTTAGPSTQQEPVRHPGYADDGWEIWYPKPPKGPWDWGEEESD